MITVTVTFSRVFDLGHGFPLRTGVEWVNLFFFNSSRIVDNGHFGLLEVVVTSVGVTTGER